MFQVKCFLHRGMFQTNMFLLRSIEGNWWLRDNSIIGTSPRLRCKKKKNMSHMSPSLCQICEGEADEDM